MWLSAYSTDAREPLHLGPSPVPHSLAIVVASAIGACLGQLVGDVLAGVVDGSSRRCLALSDLGTSAGRSSDAYEGASDEQRKNRTCQWRHNSMNLDRLSGSEPGRCSSEMASSSLIAVLRFMGDRLSAASPPAFLSGRRLRYVRRFRRRKTTQPTKHRHNHSRKNVSIVHVLGRATHP
jgi:hypothetical protein